MQRNISRTLALFAVLLLGLMVSGLAARPAVAAENTYITVGQYQGDTYSSILDFGNGIPFTFVVDEVKGKGKSKKVIGRLNDPRGGDYQCRGTINANGALQMTGKFRVPGANFKIVVKGQVSVDGNRIIGTYKQNGQMGATRVNDVGGFVFVRDND